MLAPEFRVPDQIVFSQALIDHIVANYGKKSSF